jgi:hypothetical protein
MSRVVARTRLGVEAWLGEATLRDKSELTQKREHEKKY